MHHTVSLASIAHTCQRDLLVLSFHDRTLEACWASGPPYPPGSFYTQWAADRLQAWKTDPERHQLIDWLAQQGIGWQTCAPFLPGWLADGSYGGDMCLDMACAPQHPRYQALLTYLYPADGRRFEKATLWRIPLDCGLLNADACSP